MTFSERYGYKPKKILQFESMDDDLKNSLLNVITIYFSDYESHDNGKYDFSRIVLIKLLKISIENLDDYKMYTTAFGFYNNAKWNECFDFIQTFIDYVENKNIMRLPDVTQLINNILERENSAYRVINNLICPISNESEINEIEMALQNTKQLTLLKGCNNHLTQSISLFSERVNSDYRNSIKESISAVEALVRVILADDKITLGEGINTLKSNHKIVNNLLLISLEKIYAYTNKIARHASDEEADFDDAKYILVTCSAFINYVVAKYQKAGLELNN